MKYKSNFMKGLLFLAVYLFCVACNRVINTTDQVKPDPNQNFVEPIQKIVTPAILDSLKKYGVPINEGLTPPRIDGVFFRSKTVIINSNLEPDKKDLNTKIFADNKYKFYDQSEGNTVINVDFRTYDSQGSDLGAGASGVRGFVSGSGNKFTIFIEMNGKSEGTMKNGCSYRVSDKTLQVYSGEIAPNGIVNLITSFYMKEKGPDPCGAIVDVGATRAFKDLDGFSERVSSFRIIESTVLTNSRPEILLPD